jgi:hypothetical protein
VINVQGVSTPEIKAIADEPRGHRLRRCRAAAAGKPQAVASCQCRSA